MRPFAFFILYGAVFGAALTGCQRQGPPSPEYLEASREFSALYGRHLEDAYLLPQMAPIEAKLEQVPPESEHANEAKALLQRIRSGRERVQGQRAEREELARRALEPPPAGTFRPSTDEPEAPSKPPAKQAPDAGSEQPVEGMPMAELTRRFGDCFLPGEPVTVEGRGERPTWKLRDTLFCRQQHPGFDERIVVEEAGAVLTIADRSQLQLRGDAGR